MYPVAPRIACTACKHEVFFAIRLRHSRLQLIHIFPGLRGSPWTRRSPNEFSSIQTKQADEGVGCGPGGPPHFECKLHDIGKT